MKFFKAIFALFFLMVVASAQAGLIHRASTASLANSQLNPNFLGGQEGITINAMKWSADWTCLTGGAHAAPPDLDVNGYPMNASPCMATGGYLLNNIRTSNQFERSGNFVLMGQGAGQTTLFDGAGSSSSPGASGCSGTRSGSGNITCTNSSCTSFTGQIAGQILTVTIASSCTLGLFQPISNTSTVVNQFGVPTIIIGLSGSSNCPSCTGVGGTGTYLVNWSQTIASTTFIIGMYNEISSGAEIPTLTSSWLAQWTVQIQATDASNPIVNMALVHKNDLLNYAQGQLVGSLFKTRVQQGNFAILRDLNTAHTNLANVTTWATRKPGKYFSWLAPELRNSLYAGVATYALNGSSNDYSVNLGAALPVDKQQVCIQYPQASTNSTVTFSIDGGVTKTSVLAAHGGNMNAAMTSAGAIDAFTYDATIQAWFSAAFATNGPSRACLTNFMPPEAFVEINQEVGTTPWIVEPLMASDPITDYITQYAIYVSGFSWSKPPLFEIPDETWNCAGEGVASYPTLKSRAYIAADATWSANASGHVFCGGSGDINNWTGKAASLLGQAIRQVSSVFPVIAGVQTVGNGANAWKANILSNSYVGQNPANIAIQSGCAGVGAVQTSCPAPFTQTAAYTTMKGSTAAAAGITIANYWNSPMPVSANKGTETGFGYCYFFQSGGCASQASIMNTYMAGADISALWLSWYNFANTCAGGAACTPMVVYNYEGGYDVGSVFPDVTQSATSATNANPAVLAVASNGCIAGQTVALSVLSGGTWSTAAGSYTVQATGTDANHCAINLDSTALGTLSAATMTYTNSSNYVSYLRANSWLSSNMATDNTLIYNQIASTSGPCAPAACSLYPSQFQFASDFTGNISNCCWLAWTFDLYGYAQVASTSSGSATGGNLTLGGTVTGIFTSGLTLIGGSISGATITGACSQTGSLPAGANSGDVCPISTGTASTAHSMIGTIAPPTNAAGNSTTSPVKAWGSICKWNSNGFQCDGTWLLKRDLDPASNDNDPMWLAKAA